MVPMRPKTRLWLCALVIMASAGYALLISKNSELARTIMLGYIGLVLTVFVVNQVWRKPDDQ